MNNENNIGSSFDSEAQNKHILGSETMDTRDTPTNEDNENDCDNDKVESKENHVSRSTEYESPEQTEPVNIHNSKE